MNTGMQDSINLAWKLAAVIKGERDEDFLATYNIERRRIGEHLLASTDRGFEFMATSNPVYLWLRNTLIPWVMPLLDLNETSKRNRFRFVSELDVRYRHSPIVGQASGWKHQTLRGGNRMPDGKLLKDAGEVWLHSILKSPRYHLVIFCGSAVPKDDVNPFVARVREKCPIEEGQVVLIHETASPGGYIFRDECGVLHSELSVSKACVIFVRPDGYIEWIGQVDEIEQLAMWIRASRA